MSSAESFLENIIGIINGSSFGFNTFMAVVNLRFVELLAEKGFLQVLWVSSGKSLPPKNKISQLFLPLFNQLTAQLSLFCKQS